MKEKYSRQAKGRSKKSFFVALGVCLMAVATAAFFSYSNVGVDIVSSNTESLKIESENSGVTKQIEDNLESTIESAAENKSLADISKEKTSQPSKAEKERSEKNQEENNNVESTTEDPVKQTAAQVKEAIFMYPVSSNIIKPYSNGQPAYSLTMNDWRVHNATDFSAPTQSPVKAIADGIVKEIYDDQALGKTIVIEHPNNIEASYSGLGETLFVKEGQNVAVGFEIGLLGSVPCEILEESHLHLSITKDGNIVDPMTILSQAQESTQSVVEE